MTLVVGIDPGNKGAFGICDERGVLVDVRDMPTWKEIVGKKERVKIDAVGVYDLFEELAMIGTSLVVLEGVGGRTGQSQSTGFTLGYGVGLLYMAAIATRIPLVTVSAATWKKEMGLPGKRGTKADRDAIAVAELTSDDGGKAAKKQVVKGAEQAIIKKADELFPDWRDKWRGSRGGFKLDRAEAALLSRYGVTNILKTVQNHDYRAADVEA